MKKKNSHRQMIKKKVEITNHKLQKKGVLRTGFKHLWRRAHMGVEKVAGQRNFSFFISFLCFFAAFSMVDSRQGERGESESHEAFF
jgi:hypothetical protein